MRNRRLMPFVAFQSLLLLALLTPAPRAAAFDPGDPAGRGGPWWHLPSDGPGVGAGRPVRPEDERGLAAVVRWNAIAIDASGLDHTPVTAGEDRVFGEQLGPGRSSRAMAIVHIAIFDALNAIVGGYRSYTGLGPAHGNVSMSAAIAQAAHDTLSALFPSQAPAFSEMLADDLNEIRNARAKSAGIALGQRAAAMILALRDVDGSQHAEPLVGVDFIASDEPGKWRQDPISLIPLALGAHWGEVDPFVLPSAAQFRVPPPPALTSPRYAVAFDEVQRGAATGS
jgi:hypothetical protein